MHLLHLGEIVGQEGGDHQFQEHTGTGMEQPQTEFATSLSGEHVATNILEAARTNQCGTVVVGRESFSWLKELFQHHVGEELVRKGHGLAIWVVE